ncbi:MAG: prephenate dehydrogenase/arogenate dehydrogenase family protein [Planctomycetaceae bacterium]
MTSSLPAEAPRSVAILGTGLIGASVALAASRAGISVRGWDRDPQVAAQAASTGALRAAPTLREACAGAELVVVATPIASVGPTVVDALRAAPEAVVTDAASIKASVVRDVRAAASPREMSRFVPGHPMGGSERSGPEHASASLVDAIVWVVAPTEATDPAACGLVEAFAGALGARAVRLTPERHDRLVAFVSHLPQVASTTLMGLAATEEADEPDLLLLAAGGFRDLTRLASSNPTLWSEILLANDLRVAEAIDLFIARLRTLRDAIAERHGEEVERTFDEAKRARLRLATKPKVRSGVAVLQTLIPDEPGALARITALLGEAGVNIEDLQIVHSPEGGRGTLHLTVAAASVDDAWETLASHGYDPLRLA